MRPLVRILTCLGVCAWLISNTLAWQRAFSGYQARFGPALDLPGAAPSVFFDPDSYTWLSYAQRMVATGEWRIRRTELDNAPYGREVHWSQSLAWLAALAGWMRAQHTGEAWVDAIPRAAIWLNPAVFALGLCFLFCALERRLGLIPAALAVGFMLSHLDLFQAYQPYRPDHESLHLGFALAGLVSLSCGGAGWVSERHVEPRTRSICWVSAFTAPSLASARRWFAFAGVAGGLGLWIGATPQLVALAAMGAGLSSGALLVDEKTGGGPRFAPELLRVWARAGAATSLVFYALEYQPGPLALRLEVNHPLIAIAWLAGAELLVIALQLWRGTRAFDRRLAIRVATCAVGALALPAAVALGGPAVHALRDSEMSRAFRFISEVRPYTEVMPEGAFAANFLMLTLGSLAALSLALVRRIDAAQRATLWLSGLAALAFTALLFHAQRWASYTAEFSAVSTAFAMAAGVCALGSVHRALALAWLAAIFGGGAAHGFEQRQQRITELESGSVLDLDIAQRVMIQRFAVQLASRVDAREARLMVGEPGMSTALAYFGGFASTASLYWENLDGLHATTAFFDAAHDGDARRIAEQRGLTHVLLPLAGDMPRALHRIRTGAPEDAAFSNLASRLIAGKEIPAWLVREISLDGIESCGFGGYQLVYPIGVWRIVLPATSESSASAAGRTRVRDGRT